MSDWDIFLKTFYSCIMYIRSELLLTTNTFFFIYEERKFVAFVLVVFFLSRFLGGSESRKLRPDPELVKPTKLNLLLLIKDLEEKVQELAVKTKEQEKLSRQVQEMEQTIADLQEQVRHLFIL